MTSACDLAAVLMCAHFPCSAWQSERASLEQAHSQTQASLQAAQKELQRVTEKADAKIRQLTDALQQTTREAAELKQVCARSSPSSCKQQLTRVFPSIQLCKVMVAREESLEAQAAGHTHTQEALRQSQTELNKLRDALRVKEKIADDQQSTIERLKREFKEKVCVG